LLAFAHALDDKKKSSLLYLLLIIGLSFFVNSQQKILLFLIVLLCFLYKIAKKYPISAFYKGFGYSLLFFLPFSYLNFSAVLFYLFLGILASMSEILHEANHFEQDRKEKRFTTAHWLNLRIKKETRMKWKVFLVTFGLILFLILAMR
jgi:4-hydroxybenzoate polyprenyltransferase